MVKEEIICQNSGLPSSSSDKLAEEDKKLSFSEREEDRIIEMAWEDRTSFEAIEPQFGLNEAQTKIFMKKHLKFKSYVLWRKRVQNCKTKHSKKRVGGVRKFKSKLQKAITLNKISKRKRN